MAKGNHSYSREEALRSTGTSQGAGAFKVGIDWKTIHSALLNLVYPEGLRCICCGDEIMPNQRYSCCVACLRKLPLIRGKTCRQCGAPIERTDATDRCDSCICRSSVLSGGISVMTYEGSARKLIQGFKYKDQRYLVRPLAQMMEDLLRATYLSDIDLLVPVPVHLSRRWIRGFNHAERLAEVLSDLSGIPCISRLVLRKKRTMRLARLTREERMEELQGAFHYSKKYERLMGQNVAIVDDIFTTGTTAEALAKLLIEHGAGQVYVLTVCVALPNRNS